MLQKPYDIRNYTRSTCGLNILFFCIIHKFWTLITTFIVLFFFVIFIVGCYNDPKDIPGIYYSYHERGYEALKIDTTLYIHLTLFPSGKCFIDSGLWSFSYRSKDIFFANWKDRLNVWYSDTITTDGECLYYNGNTLLRRGDIGRQYDFHKVYPNN